MVAGELTRRLAVAALGIPLALLLIILGGWPLTLLLAGVAAMATWEAFSLARARGILPFRWLGAGASALLVVLAGATGSYAASAPWGLGMVLGVFLLSSILAVFLRWPDGRPLSAVAVTVSGVLLGGGCLSFGVFLRHLPDTLGGAAGGAALDGPLLLAFPLAVTWVGDSAAFFAGHRFGRRKLIPAVSPAKTVEGAVAGLVSSAVVGGGLGVSFLALHATPAFSCALGAAFGMILGVGAQLGDLAESVLKREAGVKDSGQLLPGHGGILDRFDALLVNLPLSYGLILLSRLLS